MGLWQSVLVDPDKIEQLRQRIHEYVLSRPNEFDLKDVQNRIHLTENNSPILQDGAISDWMLRRLLLSAKQDIDVALGKFTEIFRIRTKYRLSQLTDQNMLPVELYTISPAILQGVDLKGKI